MYADYAFYKCDFHGCAISDADFPRLALRASQFLDYFTMNKAKGYTATNAVKNACCAVAEAYQSVEKVEAKSGIVSESVGSYAVSYATNVEVRAALADAARPYLEFTGLLYRGRC